MIKVLHFVSTPSIGSGVMSVIMNYYRHMDRSKIQFDFLCFLKCEDSYEMEISKLGGQVFFVAKPGRSLRSSGEIKSFIRDNGKNYDWFHNHEVYLSFWLKSLSKRYGIKNFIIHSHTTCYSDHLLSALRNKILCIPISHMECLKFACSKAAAEFLYGKNSYISGGAVIIQNAIDITKFEYNETVRRSIRKNNSLENKFIIGHIGRFEKQKNHKFILNLFKKVSDKFPDTHLILIGDGPLIDEYEKMIEKLQIKEKVSLLGKRDDVSEWLQAMDLFILPSLFEGMPVSAIEAQASGLKCLLSANITKEAVILPSTIRLSLKRPDEWVSEILKEIKQVKTSQRSNGSRVLRNAGFDIFLAAKVLETIYLKK